MGYFIDVAAHIVVKWAIYNSDGCAQKKYATGNTQRNIYQQGENYQCDVIFNYTVFYLH